MLKVIKIKNKYYLVDYYGKKTNHQLIEYYKEEILKLGQEIVPDKTIVINDKKDCVMYKVRDFK